MADSLQIEIVRNHIKIKFFCILLWFWNTFRTSLLSMNGSTRPTQKSRPVGIIVFAHVVRPYVQIYKNKTTENNVRYWCDFESGWVDHWWHLFGFNYLPDVINVPLGLTHSCVKSDHYMRGWTDAQHVWI